MSDLIKTDVNENGEILVSGRELHEFLEVSTKYADWIDRMIGYGFVENTDYIEFWSNLKNENAHLTEKEAANFSSQKLSALGYEKNHALKIDMAKEISMIQRTEKGKQARQYFIETEKKYLSQQQLPGDPITLALTAALETRKELSEVKEDVSYLKNNMRVDKPQEEEVQRTIKRVVVNALGGTNSTAYQDKSIRSKAFSSCHSEFKKYFGIPRYGDLPKSKFTTALEFIGMWEPNTALKMEIKQKNDQLTLV